MPCIIKIPFTKNPADLISKAKQAIEGERGSFTGDSNQGSFLVQLVIGKIAADYIITGNELIVTVTKKPLIVSCRKIESFLKEQIGF